MPKKSLPIAAAISVAAALALTGCGSDDSNDSAASTTVSASSSHDHAAQTSGAAQSSGQQQSRSSDQSHNSDDVMFAQMMIPHHKQAVVMSDIILGKSGIPSEVTMLAQQIKRAQQPEIDTMTSWLTQWNEPLEMPAGHDHGDDMNHGDDMEGMLSETELQQLRGADGVAAAKLFLTGMIGHHEGAIDMAEDEIEDGSYPDAIALSRTIITTQQAEITSMRKLLTTL